MTPSERRSQIGSLNYFDLEDRWREMKRFRSSQTKMSNPNGSGHLGGNCWFCGCVLAHRGNSRNRKTIDHLTPRCRGGGSDTSNLVYSCASCNNEKGQLTLEEYRSVIAFRTNGAVVFWGEIPRNSWKSRATVSLGSKLSEALAIQRRSE